MPCGGAEADDLWALGCHSREGERAVVGEGRVKGEPKQATNELSAVFVYESRPLRCQCARVWARVKGDGCGESLTGASGLARGGRGRGEITHMHTRTRTVAFPARRVNPMAAPQGPIPRIHGPCPLSP